MIRGFIIPEVKYKRKFWIEVRLRHRTVKPADLLARMSKIFAAPTAAESPHPGPPGEDLQRMAGASIKGRRITMLPKK
jgi:hypothetical protein